MGADEKEPSKMWPGQVTDGSHRTWCGDSRCGDIGHARERLSFLQGVEMAVLSERELAEMDDLLAILDVPDMPPFQHSSSCEEGPNHPGSCHPQSVPQVTCSGANGAPE
jgi:hypothetical protein